MKFNVRIRADRIGAKFYLNDMCEKCPDLDEAIERYKRVVLTIGDPQTVEVAKKLLLEVLDRKAELHPAEPD